MKGTLQPSQQPCSLTEAMFSICLPQWRCPQWKEGSQQRTPKKTACTGYSTGAYQSRMGRGYLGGLVSCTELMPQF